MLRFILGRKSSGKTTACIDGIKKHLNEDEKNDAVFIVPEQFSLMSEKLVAGSITRHRDRVEVLSFNRLSHRHLAEAPGRHGYITPVGKSMLIYKIMTDLKTHLKVFGKACDKSGFVENVVSLLSEFKRYNITPERMNEIGGTGNELLNEKIYELKLIYERYEALLSQRFSDADDNLTILAKLLSNGEKKKNTAVWIDSFSDFTLQEQDVIRAMLKKYPSVHITLCCGERDFGEQSIFYKNEKTKKRIQKIAGEENVPVLPPVMLGTVQNMSDELRHIEGHIYQYPIVPYDKRTGDISIFSASDIRTEIEAAAIRIERLVRDCGFRYKEIGITAGDLEGYEFVLRSVLKKHRIPYYIDKKEPVSAHPIVLLILSALDMLHYGMRYEHVFGYLKSGFCGIDQRDIDLLENCVLATGIKGNIWTNDEKWGKSIGYFAAGKKDEDVLFRLNRARARFLTPVFKFKERMSAHKTVSDMCRAVYALLCDIGARDALQEKIAEFEAEKNLQLSGEYRQVWNAVMDVLDQTAVVIGEENAGVDRFKKLLLTGFSKHEIKTVPPAVDEVFIGDTMRTKMISPKALFILGANEGVFPGVPKTEGIITDSERNLMAALGLELAPDNKTKTFDERFLIYNALTSARQILCVSYPIADNGGKSLLPSPVLSMLKELFPNISEQDDMEGSDLCYEYITTPEAWLPKVVSAASDLLAAKKTDKIWQDIFNWYYTSDTWGSFFRDAVSFIGYTNDAGKLSGQDVDKLWGKTVYGSVTRLEEYKKCPFSYFIKYGLRAKERKLFEITPPDVGSLLHSAVERFSKKVCEDKIVWREIDSGYIDAAAFEIVGEILENWFFKGIFGEKRYNTYKNRLYKIVKRAIDTIVSHVKAGKFEPAGYEIAFDDNGEIQPVTIELPGGRALKLTGRIDRVDECVIEGEDYVRIIDYKSGTKTIGLADIYYGLELQLCLYIDAYCESKKKHPAGMLYFKLKDPMIGSENDDLTKEELESLIEKELRMSGIVLADAKVLRAMDQNLGSSSAVIPAGVKADGEVSSKGGAITGHQFALLRRHLKKTLYHIGSEIAGGRIDINPYKRGNKTSCEFCRYHSICKFDPENDSNRYRFLESVKPDEMWQKMQ